MNDKAHRRELKERYQQQAPEAGVYLIRGTRTNRVLLGASPNLASMRGKLDFARATGSISVLDRRLHDDARRHGSETFELEIIDRLDTTPTMTTAAIRTDLATLEQLWRDRLDPATLY
jgi:hypothetical protein